MLTKIGLFFFSFFFVWVIGSLLEYFVHVFMHRRLLQGKIHTAHHKEANGQGVWGEFVDYFLPGLPILVGFFAFDYFVLHALWLGIGAIVGGIWFCAFSAYTHQLSHERPELVFWLRFPVHHIHHYHNMWHHNFGVTTLLWDRLFGTYKKVVWTPTKPVQLRNFFRIHWISANPLEEYHKHDDRDVPPARVPTLSLTTVPEQPQANER